MNTQTEDTELATVFRDMIAAFCSNQITICHTSFGTAVISNDGKKRTYTESDPNETLSIYSSWMDYGRVIGKNAKMLLALRTLAATVGGTIGKEVLLEALPPDSPERSERHLFNPSKDWGKQEVERLLKPLMAMLVPESVIDINDTQTVNLAVKIGIPRSTEFCVIRDGKKTVRLEDRTRGSVLIDAHEIQSCLRTVFAAIGKNNGRIVSLDIGYCDARD